MSPDNKSWYTITATKAQIKKERDKARELKKSRWWKQKLLAGICHYCGKKFLPEELTMDHIVPIARGGKSSKNNIVLSCFGCNQSKGLDTVVDSILDNISEKIKL